MMMHQRNISSREMSNNSEVTTTVKDEVVATNSGLLPSLHTPGVIFTSNSAVFVSSDSKLGAEVITPDHEFLAEQGYPFPPSAVAVSSYSHQVIINLSSRSFISPT